MRSAIDLTQLETVEVATWSGKRRAPGHRLGDFAVTRSLSGDQWAIVHLPTGLTAAFFDKIEPACEAMAEIARLRNDWSILSSEEARPTKEACAAIVERFGGQVHRGNYQARPVALNGYRPEAH